MYLCAFCFPGVAEQFALAEAAMNVWSMSDSSEQPSTSLQGRSCKRITGVTRAVSLTIFQGVCCKLYQTDPSVPEQKKIKNIL